MIKIKKYNEKLDKRVKNQKLIYAEEVAKLIKIQTGVNVFDKRRTNDVVEFRSLYVYLLRNVGKLTYHNIRDYFKSKGKPYDHSTALHAYKNFPMYSKYNPKLKHLYDLMLGIGRTEYAIKFFAKSLIDLADITDVQMLVYMLEKNKIESITEKELV